MMSRAVDPPCLWWDLMGREWRSPRWPGYLCTSVLGAVCLWITLFRHWSTHSGTGQSACTKWVHDHTRGRAHLVPRTHSTKHPDEVVCLTLIMRFSKLVISPEPDLLGLIWQLPRLIIWWRRLFLAPCLKLVYICSNPSASRAVLGT